MAFVIPFCGLRYSPAIDLAQVVAPPYDVISPDRQAALYDTDPHNVIRLILNRDSDPYSSAAETLNRWMELAILRHDSESSFYVLQQRFEETPGNVVVRTGFIGLCRLEEYSKKIVLPHERTLPKPRADRLRLFEATQANFCQVFGIYRDADCRVEKILDECTRQDPDRSVVFDGIVNSIWRIANPALMKSIQDAMADREILIADGHHRYETALAYREGKRERNPHHTGEEPYNYVMMFFANRSSDGLVVHPTHRVVHSIAGFDPPVFLKQLTAYFNMNRCETLDQLRKEMQDAKGKGIGMKLHGAQGFVLLLPGDGAAIETALGAELPDQIRDLDISILHGVILERILGITKEAQAERTNIDFVHDAQDAIAMVERGEAQLTFLLNSPDIERIFAIAQSGRTMPQKSTYFYPKLLSGLVMYRMVSDLNSASRQ